MTAALRIAFGALGANKLRTALTMLGIIIGVAAVIALMSVGRGAQAQVTQQIRSLGTNLLFVRPGAANQQGVRTEAGKVPTLTLDDAQAIGAIPNVIGVAPELQTSAQVLVGGQNWSPRILGVSESYASVRDISIARGQWLSTDDVESRSKVVVLGDSVATHLFPSGDPLGQTIRISVAGRTGTNFLVVGVASEKGASPLGNPDDQVYMPVTTLMTRLFAQRTTRGLLNVTNISVQIADERTMDTTVAELGDMLRARHKVAQDDFTIQSQHDFLSAANQITNTFTLLLGAIAGISLVVGGIGVMNIMLVSVTERTREVGIRRALGALRRDILTQFLVEAIVVSLMGGAVGVGVGCGLAAVISRIQVAASSGASQSLQTQVSLDSIVVGFGVAAAVGVFFGIFPAARAARLSPIEALRYE